jgi:DNA repair protein RadD
MNLFSPPPRSLPLRQYQYDNVVEILGRIWRGERRIVDKLPTRAGKTRIAIEIAKRFLIEGKRVVFVTPRKSLIEQTRRAFEREGFDHIGIIQAGRVRDLSAPVQIASTQTLARREIPDADLVIIDECHLQFRVILEWMQDPTWQDVPFVGLSATPWAKGMGKHWDTLIQPVSILDLTDQGFLTPFRILAPPPLANLTGIKTTAGDYHKGQLSKRCDQPHIVGNVVATWLKHASDRKTLVYAIDRKHAQHLQERFKEAGIACEYVDGETPEPERQAIFRRIECGETKIIASVKALDTGLDLPCVSCIVDARPTKSRMLYVQSLGRGLTAYEGKTECLFLDHAGNVRRLGLITEIGSNVLDDGQERRSAERQPAKESFDAKLCPECHCVQEPRARECPQCGHIFYAISNVIELDDELVELGSRGNGFKHEADQRQWYAGLLWLQQDAMHRGKTYKPSWPAVNFKEKFGHFPPRSWEYAIAPAEPTVEVRNYIRSRQIAYAEAMSGRR